jgi:NADH-quinone oxidoreductase subunit N
MCIMVAVSVAVLLASFVATVLLDAFSHRKHIRTAALVGCIVALCALAIPVNISSSLVRADMFTLFFSALFLLVGIVVVLSTYEGSAAYYASILLSLIGMMLTSAANDAILLFVSIELVTVPTYVLVAYRKTATRIEAGMKYFVVGIISSALLLLGLALIVSTTGTTTLSLMSVSSSPLMLLGVGALVAGFGFKLGIFPFNYYLPDVYQGAPAEIAAFLAGASKKAAYAALLRIAAVFSAIGAWPGMFAILSAVTMTVANIAALLQQDIRRVIAYSILSQAGFLLIGIAAFGEQGAAAVLFHSLTHAIMVVGALLVIGVLHVHKKEHIEDLRGLGLSNPFLGASLCIFLLSLAGIPLLAGFWSKLFLFYAAADAGMLWLVFLGVVNSIISLYYYFRIMRTIYTTSTIVPTLPLRLGTRIAIGICALLTFAIGLFPQPVIAFAAKAAAVIF